MDSYSNIDDVEAAFDRLFESFGFDAASAGGQDVGAECVGVIADSIAADAAEGKGPDGEPWPENSEPYRTEKRDRYGWDNPGYRTGQMLSLESLKGEPDISRDTVEMNYGTGLPPGRSASPTGYIDDSDRAVTDREKAEAFTHGYNSWPRAFYALNEDRSNKVVEVVREAFAAHTSRAFGGGE